MRENNEVARQAFLSGIKTAIAAIPVVGTALNEFVIDARGRIKQNRINKFVEELSEYFSQLKDVPLHIDQIEREDFGDFFEALLMKVSASHSEQKRTAFKHLLRSQLTKPVEIDYAMLMLDIVNSLHEKEIPILEQLSLVKSTSFIDLHAELKEKQQEEGRLGARVMELRPFARREEGTHESRELSEVFQKLSKREKQIKAVQEKIKGSEVPYKPCTYSLDPKEFYLLIQDLCAKGLLVDHSMQHDCESFTVFAISPLGEKLMNFLAAG